MSTSRGSSVASRAARLSAFLDYWLESKGLKKLSRDSDNSHILDYPGRFFLLFFMV